MLCNVGQPQMTADKLETAFERSNDLLNNLPEWQLSILQNARLQALQQVTQIDEALAQMQNANGQKAGE